MCQNRPKTFNTAGACVPSKHYMLPVLSRIDVSEMLAGNYYFIIQAPRQSGKTTFLEALAGKINEEGSYYALNCSLAALRGVDERLKALNAIACSINESLNSSSVPALKALAGLDEPILKSDPSVIIDNILNYLCINLDKKLAVFFDDADCLAGSGLVTFLALIRDGYLQRHRSEAAKFPSSLALMGMREIRDCLAEVHPYGESDGLIGSFNIVKETFFLPDFTEEEIAPLPPAYRCLRAGIF
jgi:hypothetical protein